LAFCLHGGFGVAAPFPLVWYQADIARQALLPTWR
jgi:hypothetical protein